MSRFPCLWCGEDFPSRDSLDKHWARNEYCRRNRHSISGSRPDARTFGAPDIMPGEGTLKLVDLAARRAKRNGESTPRP